jgi:tRNA(fMet)-specific endonuclease VapC
MTIYALDTNIIIHYLRDEPNVIRNLETAVDNGNDLVIPYIVEYEIRRGFNAKPAPNKEAHYHELAWAGGFCNVANMGDSFWQLAAQIYGGLYKKRLTIGELDILIAAFCIHNNYTLVTNNTKDFTNIDGLKIADWTQQQP